MKSIRHYFKNPWIITIGSGFILIIIENLASVIVAIVKRTGWIEATHIVLKNLKLFFKTELPLWLSLVAIAIAFFIRPLLRRIKQPVWKKYNKDKIDDWLFTWDYIKRFKKPVNIRPICEDCQCELSHYDRRGSIAPMGYYTPYCPQCRKQYKEITPDKFSDIEKVICNKIKTGKFKKSPYYSR